MYAYDQLDRTLVIHDRDAHDDVLRILDAGGSPTTRLALSPLFRKPGNKHFRACSDAVLRSFLDGLAG